MTATLVACVLNVPAGRSCEYDADYVRRLHNAVKRNTERNVRFVCLSNVDVPCERIELQDDLPGWWAKMELFRPEIAEGNILYFDLDTVIVGNIDPLLDQEHFTVIAGWDSARYRRNGVLYGNGSGVMMLTENRGSVWKQWQKGPHRIRHSHEGDGAFIVPQAEKAWDEVLPGALVSYKKHVRGQRIPDDARVVCFHGKPRPRECGEFWMATHWR